MGGDWALGLPGSSGDVLTADPYSYIGCQSPWDSGDGGHDGP